MFRPNQSFKWAHDSIAEAIAAINCFTASLGDGEVYESASNVLGSRPAAHKVH